MGFICQNCGNEIDRKHAKWLEEWEDDDGYGWSFICPICGEETYVDKKYNSMYPSNSDSIFAPPSEDIINNLFRDNI